MLELNDLRVGRARGQIRRSSRRVAVHSAGIPARSTSAIRSASTGDRRRHLSIQSTNGMGTFSARSERELSQQRTWLLPAPGGAQVSSTSLPISIPAASHSSTGTD